jgi:exosortase E/protease (VPEID-CTERM system)
VPIGIVTIFGLNAVRIALLLLIGHAGYPDVALFGFHSQAGWIAFIIGAGAVALLSRRPIFLRRDSVPREASIPQDAPTTNATAAYLVPLLAILAAGMLSRAMSGRFEVLYPLRFVLGIGALLAYRRALRHTVNWSFTWRGPVAGAVVGTLTAVTAHFLIATPAAVNPLASLPRVAQFLWMASSWGAAILVLPIAEELAYRGFLMRRLAQADFDSMPFTSVRWPAVCISAVVSAAGQGSLFLPGIMAGLAYGALIVRRARFGDAVAAHAIANAIIVAAVWRSAPWQLG